MEKRSFSQVLSAAINDLLEHGFDSEERVGAWLVELARSARDSLVPQSMLVEALRSALGRTFKREIALIAPYTLARIRPALRAELDRRILAASSLITLNRDASIQRTLQRFSGWATSIPIGGTEATRRGEAKEQIRRGIAALPFEERRVIVDQGHKLSAAVENIVAVDGGAIVGIWHHVMEGGGYQARPEHVARNGRIYVVRDNWAIKAGLMKLAGRKYMDEITMPAFEINCRCTYLYEFNLRDLPDEMLTAKGKEELLRVRKLIGGKKSKRSMTQ